MRTLVAVALASFLLVAFWASAQSQSIILGNDYIPDGGLIRRIAVDPYGRLLGGGAQALCDPTRSAFTKVWMDGGAQTLGANTVVTMNRTYVVATNNGDDIGGGTGFVKCRSDGTAPTLTAGSVGTDLSVSSSVLYTNRGDAGVRCIGTSSWVGSYECVQ